MSVRGKFRVESNEGGDSRAVVLRAVSQDETEENTRFHRYTPSGTITMQIDNPPASAQFTVGKAFYVDFTEAPA